MSEDAELMGVAVEQGEKAAAEFAVLPENWDTVRAFCAVQTQWRYASNDHLLGLDYTAVAVALKALGFRLKKVFTGLQIMEQALLAEVNNGNQ